MFKQRSIGKFGGRVDSVQVAFGPTSEMVIECIQSCDVRDGCQVGSFTSFDRILDMSFFVTTGHIAESRFEQVVTSQCQEPGCQVSLVSQIDVSDCCFQVVVSKLLWNAAELIKEPHVRIEEADHVVS